MAPSGTLQSRRPPKVECFLGDWNETQQIQKGTQPDEGAALEALEKQRLAILDEIADALAAAI
jgi:hypothetical protein